MKILGLNAYHGDSSACLIIDGQLVAAVEEERLRRIKHWAGFPNQAIEYCLATAGCTINDIDHVAVNRSPRANLFRKALYAIRRRPSFTLVKDRLKNAARIRDLREELATHFPMATGSSGPTMHYVEHHTAHLASAYLVSPYDEAAVVSVDGFGDFVGAMIGHGRGPRLEVLQRTYFPHSLGLLYLAITQFLGFPHYGDEYKVMGLAAYGEPEYLDAMRRLVHEREGGEFELALDYFVHHSAGAAMTWQGGAPTIDPVYSSQLSELLGPPRQPDEPVTQRHRNIASSLQRRYEEVFYHILRHAHEITGSKRLCLAGGCGMNSVANGKALDHTPFEQLYVPPSPGDAGGAVGAAYYVWNEVLGQPRSFTMTRADWGPEFTDEAVATALQNLPELYEASHVERLDVDALCQRTAEAIAEGLVVGWHQGRMEWGPRALGYRSILVDPRRSDMKDILNARIKRRESFRPFAPAILEEATDEYFERTDPAPFMCRVYKIRPEKHATIPAATHVDGTGRLQTVRQTDNPRYWQVIHAFGQLTGVPIVINTSFNENEPIVHTPQQAVDCFLRTKMDVLVVGPFFCRKKAAATVEATA